jgi:hypothetical protein
MPKPAGETPTLPETKKSDPRQKAFRLTSKFVEFKHATARTEKSGPRDRHWQLVHALGGFR